MSRVVLSVLDLYFIYYRNNCCLICFFDFTKKMGNNTSNVCSCQKVDDTTIDYISHQRRPQGCDIDIEYEPETVETSIISDDEEDEEEYTFTNPTRSRTI